MSNSPLPSWLQVPDPDYEPITPAPVPANPNPQARAIINKSNETLVYPYIFDHVLEQMADGLPLAKIVRNDPREIDVGHFRRWIFANPDRKAAYYDAQALGAEVLFDELEDIADGADNPLEDVQRSKLKVDVRKFKLTVVNRKRFGEVKQMEITEKPPEEMDYNQLAALIEGEFKDITDEETSDAGNGSTQG